MIWLLSFNPKEGFKFSLDKISCKTGIPLSRTRALVQELQAAGYIKLSRIREVNRFGCYHWDIYETPGISSESEPAFEVPEDLPKEEATVVSIAEFNFNRIWEAYPAHRRGDKKEALKAFNQIPDANDLVDNILSGLKEMEGKDDWTKEEGRWIPNLKKFLTNRIWEEGLENPTSVQAIQQKYMEAFKNAGY